MNSNSPVIENSKNERRGKINKYIAEFFGTFALVFAGCGAIVANDLFPGQIGHSGVSLVFGLIVMCVIYSIGNVSGAHINPAVTFAFFAGGKLKGKELAPYFISQFAGATSASLVLKLLFSEHSGLGATLPAGSAAQAFALETIMSFILMFVILNVSTGHMEKGIMAGVAVGGTITVFATFGGPISGASLNPARSFGPALVSGNFQSFWVYLTAPVLGTVMATPLCRWIQGDGCCDDDQKIERLKNE